MNYHFMVRYPGLEGAVTLCNFLCTRGQIAEPTEQTAYVTWTDGQSWQTRALGKLAAGQSMTYRESALPAEIPADATPFLFLSKTEQPASREAVLIERSPTTTPGWRGNIQLIGPTSSVSYQGEYDSAMAGIPKGSLVTLCPLAQSGNGVVTRLVFPNISKNPAIEPCKIIYARMRDRKIMGEATVYRNKCNVVAMPDAEDGEQIGIFSGEITGIPLFFSHTPDFKVMSFEHALAPLQMLLMDDKLKLQPTMKAWWLKEVLT